MDGFLPLIAHKRLVSVKLGLARANQVLKWSHLSYSKLEFQKYHFQIQMLLLARHTKNLARPIYLMSLDYLCLITY